MRSIILAAFAATFVANSAYAGQCPSMAAAIDDFLKTASVSEAVKAEAIALKDKGVALHNEGKHAESVATLEEAKKKLGM
jgi:hypothetical protein